MRDVLCCAWLPSLLTIVLVVLLQDFYIATFRGTRIIMQPKFFTFFSILGIFLAKGCVGVISPGNNV